jgi:hypothetical protein
MSLSLINGEELVCLCLFIFNSSMCLWLLAKVGAGLARCCVCLLERSKLRTSMNACSHLISFMMMAMMIHDDDLIDECMILLCLVCPMHASAESKDSMTTYRSMLNFEPLGSRIVGGECKEVPTILGGFPHSKKPKWLNN